MPSVAQYKRFSTAVLVTKRDALFTAIEAHLLRGRVTKSTNATTDIEHQMANLADMETNLANIEQALYLLDPATYPNNPRNVISTKPDWSGGT